jgi:hypothetical protein
VRAFVLLLVLVPALAQGAITFVASGAKAGGTTGTSMAPALPAGIVVGDVVIAISAARETAYAHTTATAGWTVKYDGATTNLRYFVAWMRYTGNETAPTITRGTGAQAWVGYTFAMRGVIPVGDPFGAVSTWTQGTSSPFTSTAATTSSDNEWAVAMLISGGGGSLPVQTISTGSMATTTSLLQNQTQSATTNRIVISAWRGSAVIATSGTSTGTQAITWTNTTSNYSGGAVFTFKTNPAYPISGGMSGMFP